MILRMSSEKRSVLPVHPGEVLKEEFLILYELSVNRLAKAVRVPVAHIVSLLKGEQRVTGEIAILLAHVFRTTPVFWLNLQANWDLESAQPSLSEEAIRGAIALSEDIFRA